MRIESVAQSVAKKIEAEDRNADENAGPDRHPRRLYDESACRIERSTPAWVGRLLTELGYDVRGTPATGDQGADLIAKKNGKTVIIQAKRYRGTVSNKAVQEVISAVTYYGGDEGWVVTTALSFTASAKALAQKSQVRLVDGKMLRMGTLDRETPRDLLSNLS